MKTTTERSIIGCYLGAGALAFGGAFTESYDWGLGSGSLTLLAGVFRRKGQTGERGGASDRRVAPRQDHGLTPTSDSSLKPRSNDPESPKAISYQPVAG